MLAALTLTLLLHTTSELRVWEDDWAHRVAEAGWVLSTDLAAERQDMISRHPAEYGEEVIASDSHTRTVGPATAPPPAAVYVPGVEQWRTLVEAYFPAQSVPWAMRVMACESGGDPLALNPRSGAAGLFQFIPSTWTKIIVPNLGYTAEQVWDPTANVAAAAWLLAAEGPGQWSCR